LLALIRRRSCWNTIANGSVRNRIRFC